MCGGLNEKTNKRKEDFSALRDGGRFGEEEEESRMGIGNEETGKNVFSLFFAFPVAFAYSFFFLTEC